MNTRDLLNIIPDNGMNRYSTSVINSKNEAELNKAAVSAAMARKRKLNDLYGDNSINRLKLEKNEDSVVIKINNNNNEDEIDNLDTNPDSLSNANSKNELKVNINSNGIINHNLFNRNKVIKSMIPNGSPMNIIIKTTDKERDSSSIASSDDVLKIGLLASDKNIKSPAFIVPEETSSNSQLASNNSDKNIQKNLISNNSTKQTKIPSYTSNPNTLKNGNNIIGKSVNISMASGINMNLNMGFRNNLSINPLNSGVKLRDSFLKK
jgi:hypothetical protein